MSVRGERVVYREREREVDYEEPQRRSYTTVKRYQVPDRDSRSTIFDNTDEVKEDKIVIRRERDSGRSEVGSRVNRDREKDRKDDIDIRITERTNDRERDSDRRDVTYRVIERENDRSSDRDRYSNDRSSDRDRYSNARSEYRVVERERDVVRAPSPPQEERVREYRFERERDYSPVRSSRQEREYDIERYSKTTDYYAQPQPIVIRESAPQPIIIREERRQPQQIIIRREEPAYEIIEREEVREDQQLVRQEEPAPPASTVKSVVKSTKSEVQKPQEEDYFYERRIREVRRQDDIRPSDSASQYSSDDSYEYVRRERYVDDDRDSHHKLHLAEGALAGAAGAEILRHHRKSQGKDGGHRGRDLLGGALVGAVGAEAISRARSHRGTSRRREYDDEDDRRSRREDYRRRSRSYSRSRSRSRSRSKSRIQKLGGLAAVAAVGALAGYAIKKSGSNKETVIINEGSSRRSRSRRRRSSVGSSYRDDANNDTALNPEHRNRRIAQAGLASAAAAGIWERLRSKSRGGRERSKSRVRTAAPIVGAGLGGAALAGLYERNKASKEATREAIVQDERNRGRRRHSRSRSRSAAPYAIDEGRRRDNGMVAYGNDPVYGSGARGYDDEAPGSYRRRHRHGSADSSPDTRRRSRSRGRDLATAGAGAAAGAFAAHEIGRRRNDRDGDRDHRHDDYDRYSDDYPHGDYITPPPNDYAPHPGGYPRDYEFPPPPTGEQAAIGHESAYQPYNPADYPPAGAGAARDPYPATAGAYGESDATLGAPHPHDTFAGDNRFADQSAMTSEARERQEDREMRSPQARNDPGNVSTPIAKRDASTANVERDGMSLGAGASAPVQTSEAMVDVPGFMADNASRPDRVETTHVQEPIRSGSVTPRARSTSRVRFDLGSNVTHSPEEFRRRRRLSAGEASEDNGDATAFHDETEHRTGRPRSRRPSSTLMNDPYERRSRTNDSDETIDLPERFDTYGNRKPDHGNDLASRLSELFGGSSHGSSVGRRNGGEEHSGGMLGDVIRGIAGELFRDNEQGHENRRSRG